MLSSAHICRKRSRQAEGKALEHFYEILRPCCRTRRPIACATNKTTRSASPRQRSCPRTFQEVRDLQRRPASRSDAVTLCADTYVEVRAAPHHASGSTRQSKGATV